MSEQTQTAIGVIAGLATIIGLPLAIASEYERSKQEQVAKSELVAKERKERLIVARVVDQYAEQGSSGVFVLKSSSEKWPITVDRFRFKVTDEGSLNIIRQASPSLNGSSPGEWTMIGDSPCYIYHVRLVHGISPGGTLKLSIHLHHGAIANQHLLGDAEFDYSDAWGQKRTCKATKIMMTTMPDAPRRL